MTCQDVERLLDAYVDGELDVEHALAVETHLAGCPACTSRLEALHAVSRAVKSAPYFTAPDGLAARLRPTAMPVSVGLPIRPRRSVPAWLLAAASLAIVAAGILFEVRWMGGTAVDRQAGAVIDRHLASLMADHLMDVASSDRHTVKPWFAGRIEFSPLVVDLAADGFPLKGGRLDYVDGHAAVALVYTRGQHVINTFIWPTSDADAAARPTDDPRGYHLVHWTQHGFSWWVVSDLAPADLQTFAVKLAAEDR